MSFLTVGFDPLKKEEDRLASLGTPDRLWIPPETSKEVLFIDDVPSCTYEHNPNLGGTFKNWTTCLRGNNDDVICCEKFGPKSRYLAGYYTVVDCSKYTDQNGKVHQYELKFLLAKSKTIKKLKLKKENANGSTLAGSIYKSTRLDGKSPTCGDDFEFVRKVEDMGALLAYVSYRGKKLVDLIAKANTPEAIAKLLQTFAFKLDSAGQVIPAVPSFNYEEILKPRDPKEIKESLAGVKIILWDDDHIATKTAGKTGADEEVPF